MANLTTANYIIDANSTTGSATMDWRYYSNQYTSIIATNNGQYIINDSSTIKRGAWRNPKKKRGDLDRANSSDKRLKLLGPEVMFEFVKARFKIIERNKLSKRLEMVCKIISSAKGAGQIALVESVEQKFGPIIREQELIACGFNKFISSKLLQKFIDCESKNMIKITPIKNYVRLIPKDVLKEKVRADKAKLFDDYVVVHTDPNNTSVKKTVAEKKDPILFGLVANSEKFYFVADWKDELCQLTFKEIVKALDEYDPVTSLLKEDLEKNILDILD